MHSSPSEFKLVLEELVLSVQASYYKSTADLGNAMATYNADKIRKAAHQRCRMQDIYEFVKAVYDHLHCRLEREAGFCSVNILTIL
jgi:hypothetical protein